VIRLALVLDALADALLAVGVVALVVGALT
jgi:hypothetical protein